MIRPEIMQALAGGGLTAQDYAGLTPEQIQAVASHGQQDRQLLHGLVSDMQQSEMQERKQSFDEMHQNRTFELMKNQESRAKMQMLVDTGFKAAGHMLQQRQLQLEALRTDSAIKTDEKQREKLGLEIDSINRQVKLLNTLDTTYVETPFKSADGKDNGMMSLGALMFAGSGMPEMAFKYAAAKNLGTLSSSGIPGLGIGGSGSGESNAEQVRAIQHHMWMKKGLNSEAAHIMSTLGGELTTPADIADRLKNDTDFMKIKTDAERKAYTERIANEHNDWVIKTYTGKNQTEWQQYSKEVEEEVKRRTSALAGTVDMVAGNSTSTSAAEPNADEPETLPPDYAVRLNALENSLSESERKAMEKQYPAWFQESKTYGRKVLKPNAVNLIVKEIAGRGSDFASDAAVDINQFLLELMQKDPLANRTAENRSRADWLRGVVNR